MNKTLIEDELPAELTAQVRCFVKDNWAGDFNELLAEAMRRFQESHPARMTGPLSWTTFAGDCRAAGSLGLTVHGTPGILTSGPRQ